MNISPTIYQIAMLFIHHSNEFFSYYGHAPMILVDITYTIRM